MVEAFRVVAANSAGEHAVNDVIVRLFEVMYPIILFHVIHIISFFCLNFIPFDSLFMEGENCFFFLGFVWWYAELCVQQVYLFLNYIICTFLGDIFVDIACIVKICTIDYFKRC